MTAIFTVVPLTNVVQLRSIARSDPIDRVGIDPIKRGTPMTDNWPFGIGVHESFGLAAGHLLTPAASAVPLTTLGSSAEVALGGQSAHGARGRAFSHDENDLFERLGRDCLLACGD